MGKKLPKHLNGPEGSAAGVIMKSVQLISSGLNKLNEITENYSYRNINLLSCLTLNNSKNIHGEGLALKRLFCKLCKIAVEFDNVAYITGIDTNWVNAITPVINTAEFPKYVGRPFPYTIRARDMSFRQSKMQLALSTILNVISQHSHRT